jgi:hypothetical protein
MQLRAKWGGEADSISSYNASDQPRRPDSDSEARCHDSDHGIKLLPRLPRSVFNIGNEWWIREVTGWTVSLLVIATLLATLLKYNSRALPD